MLKPQRKIGGNLGLLAPGTEKALVNINVEPGGEPAPVNKNKNTNGAGSVSYLLTRQVLINVDYQATGGES